MKQNEEKQDVSSVGAGQSAAITSSSQQTRGGSLKKVSQGIDLRKEARKIDLKHFDTDSVDHVQQIIAVMRPPKSLKE